ncbi:MAG: beta-galactosidase [Bryobacteraceae bacterium]
MTTRIAFLLAVAAAMPAIADDSPFGTWTRGTPDPAALKKQCPWVKGAFVAFPWSELEPAPGKFDWEMFEGTLARYADAGLYIQFMVWVGPHSPRWLYGLGVPEVKTTPTLNPRGEPHGWTYPFYLHPVYQRRYHNMIREVAARIDRLPPATRKAVICIQTAEGTTGDEGGYKGEPLDPNYQLPEEKWRAFKFETWRLFESLYRPKQPKVHLLINSGNQGQYHDWIMKNMPDTWRKAGNPGHGYQLNAELKMMEFLDPLINHRNANGEFIRCRSEMDETHKGWFREAPVWNQYWLNLWVLHFGIDIQQNATEVLRDPRHREGFEFVSRYGGHKDPAVSPGAWCALRDGLDAADLKRFPPAQFGEGRFSSRPGEIEAGMERCLRIARAFASRGARQGDPQKAMYTVMRNRDASAMNDVGWSIWAGNYERYLKQYDPNGTSTGWWRVGPKDQPYGRFARGFDTAAGKRAMYFDLDDRFAPRAVKVRVVYLDRGRGSWELRYDDAKTALAVNNGDTGRWKEAAAAIEAGRFANLGPHGTDLALVHTGGEDTLFHMIEVTRR